MGTPVARGVCIMTSTSKPFSVTFWITIVALFFFCLGLGTAIGVTWSKSEVTPIVLVEPDPSSFSNKFRPLNESNLLGNNSWTMDDVQPVVLVKPSFNGFVPIEGSALSMSWSKSDIVPVMLVEPSGSNFEI